MCRIWSVWLVLLLYIHYSYGGTPFFRKDYEFNADTQNFYKIHTVARTWTEAKTRCQQEGAALFAPDTKQDYDAVVALMQTKLPMWQWAFIGIHDLLSEGEFITVDGQNLEDVYHVWGEGEPNNSGGNENCVIIRKAGIINDDNCLNRYPFICKKSRATLEWNVLCDMPDQDYLFDKDLGKCYKLHLHPKNWTEAFGVCAAEQSYLAVINSKAESDYLRKKVADAPKNTITEPYLSGAVHLGYHNRLGEGFTTVQGVPLQNSGFAVWGGGQPDNSGGTEKCGSMFYDGTLNDISCHVVCIFICEHDIGFLSSSVDERIKDNVA